MHHYIAVDSGKVVDVVEEAGDLGTVDTAVVVVAVVVVAADAFVQAVMQDNFADAWQLGPHLLSDDAAAEHGNADFVVAAACVFGTDWFLEAATEEEVEGNPLDSLLVAGNL